MLHIAATDMTISTAVECLRAYPSTTPIRFDLPRCLPGPITSEEIRRTRDLHSRISHAQSTWFQERSLTCDWSVIDADASLADAAPESVGGLYDQASAIYDHFWIDRPSGIATAKVSKVLHLKYPALIPILDSRLLRLYRPAAISAMLQSPRWVGLGRPLYWEAVRQDLLRSDMPGLRAAMSADGSMSTLLSLTDLRLLDALAWRL